MGGAARSARSSSSSARPGPAAAPSMREGSALPGGPGAAAVPGFLAKLWALVEDPQGDDVICWSRNGENFCILDEQRFAKELLPKYFKHNNISSFIRQLNMYGFRKVIALENGMITAEKSSVIEFQHAFFKQGKAHLLENIKRKVSAVRTEDLKVCAEDLHKVLSEVQEMREQQKHSQQQKLLSKILQFILSLMRGNYIVGVKRKRWLFLNIIQMMRMEMVQVSSFEISLILWKMPPVVSLLWHTQVAEPERHRQLWILAYLFVKYHSQMS